MLRGETRRPSGDTRWNTWGPTTPAVETLAGCISLIFHHYYPPGPTGTMLAYACHRSDN